MKNFLFINKFPNELNPEREIRKGRAWSQFEALNLFNVLQKYRFLVSAVGYTRAIGILSKFNEKFLIYQQISE